MSFYVKLFSEKANEVLEDIRQMIGLDLQADSFVNAIIDISEAINQDPRGLYWIIRNYYGSPLLSLSADIEWMKNIIYYFWEGVFEKTEDKLFGWIGENTVCVSDTRFIDISDIICKDPFFSSLTRESNILSEGEG